jgi:Carboxypeptidase regulatory-like domain
MRLRSAVLAVLVSVVLLPAALDAQGDRASISGQVIDSTGALLPGVTVEASSPVLIERSRTGVTDGAGRFSIVDLRPGTYTVTFTLAGFRSVRREGILLEGAFAAQVNTALAIGAVEETITVPGASPVVDVQSTRAQFVNNKAILESLPVARTLNGGMSLVPGVNSQNNAAGSSPGQILADLYVNTATVHGSVTADQHSFVDGMNITQMLLSGGGQIAANPANDLTATEIVYDVSSQSAEIANAGVRGDVIPKEGGNVFAGTYRAFGTWPSLVGNNLTPELKQFITSSNRIDYNWESNLALGGPIRHDKLWYFGALKLTQQNILATDSFFPDGRQAGTGGHVNPNVTARITYQVMPHTKLRLSANHGTIVTERFDVTGSVSPEANLYLTTPINYSFVAKGASVITNRLLLEYAESFAATTYEYHYQPQVGPNDVQHFNATTGRATTAFANPTRYYDHIYNTIANVSYVTGSHAFKVGGTFESGFQRQRYDQNGDISQLIYVNNAAGVAIPNSVSVRNTFLVKYEDVNAHLGIYGQDKWTLRRMTFNLGGRFDYLNASVPVESNPAGRFVPERSSDAISCLPCWKQGSIRLGASYDVFGTGRTAVKGTIGKYVASQSAGVASTTNPMQLQTDTRAWVDLDGNGSALDAAGNAQYAEIGPVRNSNFGIPKGATRFDPLAPWPTNWEESASIVQQLFSTVSVTAAYYHREYFNQSLTRNVLVNPLTDYTAYTITVPANAKLPNGGGQTVTVYNLNANKLGAVDSVSTYSTANTRVYNGFEFSANARLPRSGFLFGSVTEERSAVSNCDVSNSDPNNLRFCNQVPPFRGLFKVSGAYSLPYDVQLSSTLQFRPGESVASSYTFNSAAAGFPITGGGNLTVANVVDPTTQFYDYIKEFDMRLSRTFRFGPRRLQTFLEVFNLPNVSTVLQVNTRIGPLYYNPQLIEQPRHFQIGAQFDF